MLSSESTNKLKACKMNDPSPRRLKTLTFGEIKKIIKKIKKIAELWN